MSLGTNTIPGYEFEPAEQVVLVGVRDEMGNALVHPETRAAHERDGRWGRRMRGT